MVCEGEWESPPTGPCAFWLKPVSIFGLLDLTTFISGSPGLTRPSLLAPDHVDARSRHRPSRLDGHPVDEGTLSRELRTAGLLQPRVPVGDQWQNIGIRPILLSYQVSTQLRVAPPTDPDVRDYRIRLVQSTVHTRRYTEWTTRAAGSGYRSSRPHRLAHPKQPFQLRRESHFRQIRATIALIRDNEAQFPVTP